MAATNRPALFWMLAEAFGNFIGAGVFGFMITLPQINLFSHGTQWTVSHGHFAFWGAYACGVLSVCYLALQKAEAALDTRERRWLWPFVLLNGGLIGMAGALLVSGISQSFFERSMGGSTLDGFISGQENQWFVLGMQVRLAFGAMFAIGYFLLIWDLAMRSRRTTPIPQPAITA